MLNEEVEYKREWPGHGVAIIFNKRTMADGINHSLFNVYPSVTSYVSVLISALRCNSYAVALLSK